MFAESERTPGGAYLSPAGKEALSTLLHGENTDDTGEIECGRSGDPQRRRMVYTPALVLGPGMPHAIMPKEDSNVVKLMRKFVSQTTSSDEDARTSRHDDREEFTMERSSPSLRSDASEYDDAETTLQREDMTREIERCLTDAKRSRLRCQVLLLPRRLTEKVARDVVRSSADEPCGVRGASIRVYLDMAGDTLLSLGNISPDPAVTPTFELSVVFRVDRGLPPLKLIFLTDKVLKLRPEYRLIKKKLYSSAGPVIHDFD